MDADKNVLGVLTDAGITALVELQDFPYDKVPFILLAPFSGSRRPDAFENASWSMSAWAETRNQSRRLWLSAADAIHAAYVGSDPRINFAETLALPLPVPSGMDGIWRYEATVRASVRN